MKHHLTTLSTGLRVLSVPMPSLPSATVTIWVKTGSRNEEVRVNGISHFLEHMTFKGSRRRPSAREISEAVDAIGGEFNAGTSKEWTNFYIKARSANLETAFDVLSDMVLNPLLEEVEIEREKGVIVEEIAMYEDTPMYRIGDIFEQLIFNGSSLGWDIAGTEKSVRSIKKEDFERYRKIHYYADNILLTVAGGVKENEVLNLAKKYFSDIESKPLAFKSSVFKSRQNSPQLKLHSKKKEQAHFILGFRGNPMGHKDRFTDAVLSSVLGGGMSARLFIEVRERRGLAYAIKNEVEKLSDTGYVATYAGVDVKKAEEAIKVVLDQHYGLAQKRYKIFDKELRKAKEYLKGHLALALEDTHAVSDFFGLRELLLGKAETPEEIFKAIDTVTMEEVYEEAERLFKPQGLNLAIIGPYNDQGKFEKLLK
ncbi:insulinase family protein [Candidatus Woesebacteria bacterium]|nr:insulinase family protein [Candidatus Woesebacteria bacterium]